MSRLGAIPGSNRPGSFVRPGSTLPGGGTAGGFGVTAKPGTALNNFGVVTPPTGITYTGTSGTGGFKPMPGSTAGNGVVPGSTMYRPPVNTPARQPTSNPWGTPPAQPAPTNGQGGQIMPGTGTQVPTQTPQGYPINTFMGGGASTSQPANNLRPYFGGVYMSPQQLAAQGMRPPTIDEMNSQVANGEFPASAMGGPFATPGFNPNGSTGPTDINQLRGLSPDAPFESRSLGPGPVMPNVQGITSSQQYNQAMQGMGNVADQLAQPYGPGSQNPERPLPQDAIDLAPPNQLVGNPGIDTMPPLTQVPFGGGNQQLPANGMQPVGPQLPNPFQNMPPQVPFGQGPFGQQPQPPRPLAGQGQIPGSRPPSGPLAVPGEVFGQSSGGMGGQPGASPVGNVGSVNPQGIGPISNPQQNPLSPIGNASGNTGQGGPFNNNWDGGRGIMATQYQQVQQATQQRVAADAARRMADAESQLQQRLAMQSQYPENFGGATTGPAAPTQEGSGEPSTSNLLNPFSGGYAPDQQQSIVDLRNALMGDGFATSLAGRRQSAPAGVTRRPAPVASMPATQPVNRSMGSVLSRMSPAEMMRYNQFKASVR